MDKDPVSSMAGGRAVMSLVRGFAAYSGHRGTLALLYIALGAIFEGAGLLLIIPLLSLVTGQIGAHGRLQQAAWRVLGLFGGTTALGRLSVLLGGFVVLMAVRAVVIVLRDTTVLSLRTGFIESFRHRIAQALSEAGWDQVLRLRHARIQSIMGSDIQRLAAASAFLLQVGIAIVLLFSQCLIALFLSPLLALFSIALLAVSAVAMIPVLRRARELGRYETSTNLLLTETTAQFLSGLKLAVSQGLQGGFVDEFHRTLQDMTAQRISHFRRQTMARIALTTLTAVVGAAVILVGYGYLALSPPLLIAFLLVVARTSGPALQIQQGVQQLAHALPSYEAILALLSDLGPHAAPAGAAVRQRLDGPIVFDGVCFAHVSSPDGRVQGIRGASLTIQAGCVLGIGGPSGAGKTTFADLLVGLLKPQAGRIVVGGVALEDAVLPSWRAQLSYVSQDPFLFHDTVRRNLLWASPGATEDELWNALAQTGADGIVRRMEGGLDAIVGERGSLVSGGERQRIALARALLRRPRLLVMDEATNAIDVAGEHALLERLSGMVPRPTTVLIAHRAETLALCDRVVRIVEGRIVPDDRQPVPHGALASDG